MPGAVMRWSLETYVAAVYIALGVALKGFPHGWPFGNLSKCANGLARITYLLGRWETGEIYLVRVSDEPSGLSTAAGRTSVGVDRCICRVGTVTSGIARRAAPELNDEVTSQELSDDPVATRTSIGSSCVVLRSIDGGRWRW